MVIYTDGACEPNPGRGGWAFVILDKEAVAYKESGFSHETTNNIMELTGILRAISYGVEIGYESILIKTDSQYCIGVLTGEYKVKKNKELINEIHELISYANSVDISVDFEWVRGHDGDMGNESADYYANRACRGV